MTNAKASSMIAFGLTTIPEYVRRDTKTKLADSPDTLPATSQSKKGAEDRPHFPLAFPTERRYGFPHIHRRHRGMSTAPKLRRFFGAPLRSLGIVVTSAAAEAVDPTFNNSCLRHLTGSIFDPTGGAPAPALLTHCASCWCNSSTRRNNATRPSLPSCRMRDPVIVCVLPLLQTARLCEAPPRRTETGVLELAQVFVAPPLLRVYRTCKSTETRCPAASRRIDWRSPHPIPRP